MKAKDPLGVLRRAGILEDLLYNLGLDDDATPQQRVRAQVEILNMSAAEMFERYMTWKGIIGYEDDIVKALRAIQRATGKRLV